MSQFWPDEAGQPPAILVEVRERVGVVTLNRPDRLNAWTPAMGTLFVGSAHERLINDGGVIHPAEVVTLSLTFDHKVVNGASAAAFLQEVKSLMEAFKLPG